MSAMGRLLVFAAGLAVLFAGAALAGGAIDPDREEPAASHAQGNAADDAGGAHTEEESESHGGAGGSGDHGAEEAAHPVRGVAVSENGLRLVIDDPELRRGRTETLRFRIADAAGDTVRDFDVEHTKRMHVIVARRDLTGFQHLHPKQRGDGSWGVPVRLAEAGSYRLFADFSHSGEATTLGTDLRVDGPADLHPLPAPAPTAVSDGGYDVRLDTGAVKPGAESELRFTVTRDGQAVHTEPYLGAGGHLVALREGDLAFLHVHPTEHGHGEEAAGDAHDDRIGFAATFPTRGRYRLFLQVLHEGRVHTVAFTQEVR